MKETQQQIIDKPVLHAERQVQKMRELVTALQPKPGQHCYEVDLRTGIVKPATFKKEVVVLVERRNLFLPWKKSMVPKMVKEIEIKPQHLYCCALNEESAARKFAKTIEQFK